MNPELPRPEDHALDRCLREAFTHADRLRCDAPWRRQRPASGPHSERRWPWLLAAAALLVTLAIACVAAFGTFDRHDGERLGSMWAAAYQHAIDNVAAEADKPSMCCDPTQDFGAACERRFAVRLTIDGEDLVVRGCYSGLPTGGCVAAMAETRDGPIGVFVVGRDDDPRPWLPPQAALQLVRRELGPLVLYAVARRQQPPRGRRLAAVRVAAMTEAALPPAGDW